MNNDTMIKLCLVNCQFKVIFKAWLFCDVPLYIYRYFEVKIKSTKSNLSLLMTVNAKQLCCQLQCGWSTLYLYKISCGALIVLQLKNMDAIYLQRCTFFIRKLLIFVCIHTLTWVHIFINGLNNQFDTLFVISCQTSLSDWFHYKCKWNIRNLALFFLTLGPY